jgi:L-lactate dehydrogenase (cytochrome)/(S)-mandelate dehydrogenase
MLMPGSSRRQFAFGIQALETETGGARSGMSVARAMNIDDLAAIARRRLPAGLYDFIDRGAEDEVTRRDNAESIKRVHIRQRVGVDVSSRDCSTSLFGIPQSLPIGIGVAGLTGMLAYEGELAIARAAAAARVPYTIGSSNFAPLASLKPILGDLLWRQIYPPKLKQYLDYQLDLTRDAGIATLVVTLDSPVAGNREYMRRNGFMPGHMNWRTYRDILAAPRWFFGVYMRYMLNGGLPQIADMPEGQRRFFGSISPAQWPGDNYSWEDIRGIRRKWPGRLVLKGISTPQDALNCAECGVDGLIVSNHGGRSLDGCVPSMAALPQIVDVVGDRMAIMIDGGFKRGADVLKAIAMGAQCVWLGRAPVFGLAAGDAGVTRALQIFAEEIDRALAMSGHTAIDQLTRDILAY